MREFLVFAAVMCLLGSGQTLAQNAYITNAGSNTVSVIDTRSNRVIGSPIPVGDVPIGVAVAPDGRKVYVANNGTDTISVIDTAANIVIATIAVGPNPFGVAVSPDSSKVYVANSGTCGSCTTPPAPFPPDTVSVIDASTNTVIGSAIPVGSIPLGLAVTPDGRKVYVANFNGNTVSVIDTATTTVTSIPLSEPHDVAVSPDGSKVYVASASGSVFVVNTATNALIGSPISAGLNPLSLAVAPDGSKIYVTNNASNNDTASVIDTAMNAVVATITVGLDPFGVAVTPDGRKVYVVNSIPGTGPGTVSVINTSANRVTAMIPVGVNPAAFGLFIQPAPRFAGTPGKANCHGKSVSALAKQYGGLNGAAAALGFDSVKALQIAIDEFCTA